MKRIAREKESEENKKREKEFKEVTSKYIQRQRQEMISNILDSYDKTLESELNEIRRYKEFHIETDNFVSLNIDYDATIQDDLKMIMKDE